MKIHRLGIETRMARGAPAAPSLGISFWRSSETVVAWIYFSDGIQYASLGLVQSVFIMRMSSFSVNS